VNARAFRRSEVLRRVDAFGAAHAGQFPDGTVGRRLFATVGKCVKDVARHAAAQRSGRNQTHGAAHSRTAARAELRRRLNAIRRTALALAVEEAGFDIQFPLPRGNGDHELLTASRLFAAQASARAGEFIELGLPSSFLEDLAAGITALEETTRARSASRVARLSSNGNLKTALDDGFQAVRKLDAVVPNVLEDDPATLTAWRRARSVTRDADRGRLALLLAHHDDRGAGA
jgi:hypothetical protein